MRRRPVRPVALCLLPALALAALLAGCGGDEDNPVVPQPEASLPPNTPEATTPTNLLARFDAAYEYKHQVEFGKLLTSDYRFTFSNQSDPELVSTWGNLWGRTDETESMKHLTAGFTDDQGQYQPPTSSIDLTFEGVTIAADTSHADSSDHYKVAFVPRVVMQIALSDGREFSIDAPHDFYLVRGDAAVLASGQAASADRWYIRHWVDKSPSLFLLAAPLPAENTTWGSIKAQYR